ncbi:MAG TPA: cobalamin-binding protein [Burkholderiaceae bacterium]
MRASFLAPLLAVLLDILGAGSLAHAAPVTVRDDLGHTLTLPAPAQRVVSLAPHTTELLFAIGAGSETMGVSQFSDYPEAAKRLPQLGGAAGFDLERIAALKPDLVLVWHSGISPAQIETIKKLGLPVFESEPHDFATVASSLERLGQLTGKSAQGKEAATAFRARWQALLARYAHAAPVTVFYQIWSEPLMTLNDSHLASAAIALCGGRNVFGKLGPMVPTVNTEAVLQANPDVILTGSDGKDGAAALAPWKKFPQMTAVRRDNLFALDSDILTRGGPRILDGAEAICGKLDIARQRISQK